MTKREHKANIRIEKRGAWKDVYYFDIFCESFSPSWTTAEIKEEVYKNLKERGLLLG